MGAAAVAGMQADGRGGDDGDGAERGAAIRHAFRLFVAVSAGSNISGGHVNPAVTFGLFVVAATLRGARAVLDRETAAGGSTVACLLLHFSTGGLATDTFGLSGVHGLVGGAGAGDHRDR